MKEQENKLLRLNNNENKAVLQLKRDNMQILFTLQHEFDVAEIGCINEQVVQETEKIKKEIQAIKKQSEAVINANSIKELAMMRAQSKATKILKEAEAYEQKQKLKADNQAEIIRKEAKARLEIAEN